MTYSIVARDPSTGDLGVAVQSHWFAAGRVVPWAEAGVGAVATQAMVDVAYGPRGLDLMRGGASAPDALERLLADDDDRDVRQVSMVDAAGGIATHTGARTIPEAGHVGGDVSRPVSCQANMMWDDTVWGAMSSAYDRSEASTFAERLLDALDAAEAERGDIRGRQAAGILIVGPDRLDEPWRGVRMELSVDDHPTPLPELRRLVRMHLAYEYLDRSEQLGLKGDADGVARERAAALALAPEVTEIAYWSAIGLAAEGRADEARALIESAYGEQPGWRELLRRLVAEGLLPELDPEAAAVLLADRSDQT